MPSALNTNRSLPAMLVVLGLMLGLYLFVLRPMAREKQGALHPAIGARLEHLSLEPLTGKAEPLALADLAGKIVLVNFWGTWCPPCRAEFPHLVRMEAAYRDNPRIRLLLVSCGGGDEIVEELRNETEGYLQSLNVEVPTYHDPQYLTRGAVAKLAGDGFAYPTTIILDANGTLRGLWIGYQPGTETEMQELIEELLSEKPTP